MRRFPKAAALLLLAGLCLAQNASIQTDPDVRRVGSRLACLCSRCKNSVGDCQMMGCGYAGPAREQIQKAQTAGISDDAIVASFVQREGIKALVVPPAQGFNIMAWVTPVLAVLAGLAAIFFVIRRYRNPAVAVAKPSVAAKYSDLAGKDLAKLE